MRFLAFSPQAAYALLAGVAALIFLFYLLKPRPRRVVVSSNLIWRRLSGGRGLRTERWRWLGSLLLATLIGVSIALALTRPEVPALGGVMKRVVLVLDNSSSMAARASDGRSRWDHALEHARKIVHGAGAASEFMVKDTMGYSGVSDFTGRTAALAAIEKLSMTTTGVARLPLLPPTDNDRTEVYLFTDGVAALKVPQRVVIESVFEPADNAAITAFETRALPQDPTRYQAFVQIFNASKKSKRIRLELSGAAGFTLMREAEIPASETSNQILDVSRFERGVLRARVHMDTDAFALDDVAYSLVAPHQTKRVLLVTKGNAYLEESLKSLPSIQLTTLKPAAYRASLQFDAYVFDRFSSREPPPSGVLLFRPPPVPWLPVASSEVKKPTITKWDETHPLASAVSWRDVRLARAVLSKAASLDNMHSDVVLAEGSGEGAVVLAGKADPRWIEVGFALEDSNLHLQAGFPVFLGRALDWLAAKPEILARGLGTIEVPLTNAHVLGIEGRRIGTIHTPTSTVFEAVKPDVFTIRNDQQALQVVANVVDPRFSEINRSRFADGKAPRGAQTTSVPRWAFEPWMLLLSLAAVLLIFEWLTFSRRVTV